MYDYQNTESARALLENVGDAFIQLRQGARLTQRKAAKLANSTQARISDIENGKADIQLLTLLRWANVYGYDIEVVFNPIEDTVASLLQEIEKE